MEQQNVREMEETNESECVVCCFVAYASAFFFLQAVARRDPSIEDRRLELELKSWKGRWPAMDILGYLKSTGRGVERWWVANATADEADSSHRLWTCPMARRVSVLPATALSLC